MTRIEWTTETIPSSKLCRAAIEALADRSKLPSCIRFAGTNVGQDFWWERHDKGHTPESADFLLRVIAERMAMLLLEGKVTREEEHALLVLAVKGIDWQHVRAPSASPFD
jgi:hypothetical protein